MSEKIYPKTYERRSNQGKSGGSNVMKCESCAKILDGRCSGFKAICEPELFAYVSETRVV